RSSVKRIGYRGDASDAAVDRESLIQGDGALLIEDIEPVCLQSEFALFVDFDWVIHAEIGIRSHGRAVLAYAVDDIRKPCLRRRHFGNNSRPSQYSESFVIPIDGMGKQLVEGGAGLNIPVSGDEEFPRCPIAAVELELVRPV